MPSLHKREGIAQNPAPYGTNRPHSAAFFVGLAQQQFGWMLRFQLDLQRVYVF